MSFAFRKRLNPTAWVNLCAGLALAGLLSGCAFSRTTVKVDFKPSVNQPLKTAQKASLEVGEVKDTRLVTDKFVLMQKGNQYGATSGAYVTEQPVADIFRDGLKSALAQNGFTQAPSDQYLLQAEIQNFGIGVIQNGLFSSVTAKPWLEVRFELDSKATGLPVWHDTFTGQANAEVSQWQMTDEAFLVKAFPDTAQAVLTQLLADRGFRSFFE